MVSPLGPLRRTAILMFRATEWADSKGWPGFGRVVYLPVVLAGFLLGSALNRDYALLGAVVPGAILLALALYGGRIAPRRPREASLAERLDALSARAEALEAAEARADPPAER